MNATHSNAEQPAQDHGQDHGHDHGVSDGHSHGTRRSYLTGFVMAVVLTAIPFWLVMSGVLANPQVTALVIFAFAFVQIIVHAIYFLHLDTRSESGWTLMAFVFTVVIVAITIAGSIWIMYHLDLNMMPMGPGGKPGVM
jgi:cytochrome o ubiquinol oxidase operon protein cyoD